MPRKFIDLSVSLQEGIKSDPDFMLPKINYHHHNETAEEMISFFPGLKKEDLPGGEGWAMETITVSTHNGTHMDAPYHYHSTMDNGRRAITIDEVPLEWCFSDGIKLDLRSYDDGYVLTESDIKSELKKINYKLKPLDIVFVNTSAGECYGQDDFLSKGCGIGREATIFLLIHYLLIMIMICAFKEYDNDNDCIFKDHDNYDDNDFAHSKTTTVTFLLRRVTH